MAHFDERFDWVVVGSGAGSMSSALLMKKAGKTVVILEKAPWVGGTTAKSGGQMWIPNNRFMDPGEDSTKKALEYLNSLVRDDADSPGTSPERRMTYVVEAPKMLEFIIAEGVEMERAATFWPDYYDELPGGVKSSRIVTAVTFNKNKIPGGWARKLRQGFLEYPVRMNDALQFPFWKNSWRIRKNIATTAVRYILGKFTGKHWVAAGAALQGRLLKVVLEKDAADIRVESPVSEIIMEDGKAVGVVTVKGGKPWRIGANTGILINAGGFSQNQAMRDKYMPKTRKEWSNGIESNTGDMHLEMERIGGFLAQMDEMVGFQITRSPGWDQGYTRPNVQSVMAKPHAIQVDQTGVRYMNECGSYMEFCKNMIERDAEVPTIPSWAIMDSQFMMKYPMADKTGSRIPRRWRDTGYLKEAMTIEGLAKLIDIDPATLLATIERWNGFVEKGEDEDFHRGERAYDNFLGDPFFTDGPNRTMGRIDKPPFYAVDIVPGDVGTYGGVVTDAHARVLREDGSPIEGLYACGIATASPMGRVYPGGGGSVGPAMTFGWIAARHAAGVGNQPI